MADEIVLNNLGINSNLKIYQNKAMFNYSVDTILFGNFIFLNKSIKRALEIGTNNGALAIFVASRMQSLKLDAVEIQSDAADLAKQNISLNQLDDQINLIHADYNDYVAQHKKMMAAKYDLIFVNPPYYPVDSTILPESDERKLIATHELKLNLEQIISGAKSLIKEKGYLDFVIPIERFVDLVALLRVHKFEAKRIQFVYPRINEKPKFVFVESRFNAGYGQHYLNNLYLHPEDINDHSYLPNIIEWYRPWKVNNE